MSDYQNLRPESSLKTLSAKVVSMTYNCYDVFHST